MATAPGTELVARRKNIALDPKPTIELQRKYYSHKRLFDIFFSLAVIVFVLSWLYPLLALLIKLTSRGPVLFIQKRVGFAGRSFNCYKFRTMVVNKEANTKQAVENDPRITRIGRFLRVSNLDEFPQFFNVLKGDMSIVGPRPHMHKDCQDFSAYIVDYKFRNLTKPGITGLSQVKGYRGPTKDFESIFRRYQWDCFYVRNMSFRMDMRIIRMTAVSTLVAIFSRLAPVKRKVQKVEYRFSVVKYLNSLSLIMLLSRMQDSLHFF